MSEPLIKLIKLIFMIMTQWIQITLRIRNQEELFEPLIKLIRLIFMIMTQWIQTAYRIRNQANQENQFQSMVQTMQ